MIDVTPMLWFADKAEEAASLYVSLIPNSRIDSVTSMPSESPSGPPGTVQVVEFTLGGRPFTAMGAGPLDPFNHAVSFVIGTESQTETDRIWDALLDGGQAEQCGWLKDRYGVSWQVCPKRMFEMMKDPDRAAAKRATDAMLTMVKLDLPALERAFAGQAA